MPINPHKTPQQKKALSYAKDRRNAYRENDKASRKAIPARKAEQNRRVRRNAKQKLDGTRSLDEEGLETVESSLKHDIERVGGWKKDADIPLGEKLSRKKNTN